MKSLPIVMCIVQYIRIRNCTYAYNFLIHSYHNNCGCAVCTQNVDSFLKKKKLRWPRRPQLEQFYYIIFFSFTLLSVEKDETRFRSVIVLHSNTAMDI